MPHTSIRYVRDIPKNFVFTANPNDVRLILETIGKPRARVTSVFTHVSGGELTAVYGMAGYAPEPSKPVRRLY
jgi:hypothetical protein